MEFEFDHRKSVSNREKHGIDFEEAKKLWADESALVAPAKRVSGERRWLLVGLIGAQHWTAVYTMREDKIRIISVRRSTQDERDNYQDQNN